MRNIIRLFMLLLGCFLIASQDAMVQDAPSTHVVVGLFYKHPVKSIKVDSQSHSLICGGRPVLGPVSIEWLNRKTISVRFSNGEISKRKKLVFNSSDSYGIEIVHPDFKKRSYTGKIIITPDSGGLSFIEWLDFEDYLKPVVSQEMRDCAFGLEDLKAQAVACRTFAFACKGRHKNDNFDFCDSPHCQAYQGIDAITPEAAEAVSLTRGKILIYQGKPALTYFHSTCGGYLADVSEVWQSPRYDYLISHRDGKEGESFCRASPYFVWQSTISRMDLQNALAKAGVLGIGEKLKKILISGYDQSHRVATVVVIGKQQHQMTGTEFWTSIGRVMGWDVIKSTLFTMNRKGSVYILTGHGIGHGVGLCQWGASGMARQGYTYLEILKHYYPNTEIAMIKDKARLLKTANSP